MWLSPAAPWLVSFPSHFPDGNTFLHQPGTGRAHFSHWHVSKPVENGNSVFSSESIVPAVAVVTWTDTEGVGNGWAFVAAQPEVGMFRILGTILAGLELGSSHHLTTHLEILARRSPQSQGRNGKRNAAFSLLHHFCVGVLTHQGRARKMLKDLATEGFF